MHKQTNFVNTHLEIGQLNCEAAANSLKAIDECAVQIHNVDERAVERQLEAAGGRVAAILERRGGKVGTQQVVALFLG